MVHIIVLPVSEDRPADDFFRKVRRVFDLRSYHLEVKFHTCLDAFEVVCLRTKNRIKLAIGVLAKAERRSGIGLSDLEVTSRR